MRGKRKAGRNTTTVSVRIPFKMHERVQHYAKKRQMTVNDWLKGLIANAARYKLETPKPPQKRKGDRGK